LGFDPFARGRCAFFVKKVLFIFLLSAVAWSHGEEVWRSRLTPTAGPFPMIRPFQGEFRFGWSNIAAASARANFAPRGNRLEMDVWGGTTGAASFLWELNATHTSVVFPSELRTDWFFQEEKYASRTVYTQAVYQSDGLWRQRDVVPDPNGPARWKQIKIAPSRGLVATMLFIRSQPLNPNDRVGVIAFPGDDSYLVEIRVVGRETIKVAGESYPAIKLDFGIQKIVRDKKSKRSHLEPHKKFRSGRVWISDDANRMALRIEVNIFIGYVFGELVEVNFR